MTGGLCAEIARSGSFWSLSIRLRCPMTSPALTRAIAFGKNHAASRDTSSLGDSRPAQASQAKALFGRQALADPRLVPDAGTPTTGIGERLRTN